MTLKLNGSSSGYTAIDAPASAGSNTLVLPADNGSANEVLKTDGSGNLDWVAQSAGGKILQVVSTTTGSGATITASGVQDTGLSLAITPATGNKVLVQISTHVGMDQPTASNNTVMFSHLYIYRGSGGSGTKLMESRIGGTWGGDSSTSGCDNYYASYPLSVLDASPGGNGSTAITYSIYTQRDGSNPPTTMYFNGSGETTITLMEIAA